MKIIIGNKELECTRVYNGTVKSTEVETLDYTEVLDITLVENFEGSVTDVKKLIEDNYTDTIVVETNEGQKTFTGFSLQSVFEDINEDSSLMRASFIK